MKLFLVPFNFEAKVLTAILPNCKKVPNSLFQNRWEYKGGEVVSWNEVGTEAIKDVIMKIGNFEKYSSVILFGSAGSLSPNLNLGELFVCTTIKDTENNCWKMPALAGFNSNSMLTTKEMIFDNNLRKKYFQEFNCELVDMEASIFAKLSAEGYFKDTESFVIRFVSDNYETLPPLVDGEIKSYSKSFMTKAHSEMIKYRKILI